MTECEMCLFFEGKGPLLSLEHLCDDCQTWHAKVLGVRRKYLNMMKELKEY